MYFGRSKGDANLRQVYELLFVDLEDAKPSFTLGERLKILGQMNEVVVAAQVMTPAYWEMLEAGLYHTDPLSRKMAVRLIQQNLASSKSIADQHGMTEKEFESAWATFFELYDTLDSYSSHLTRAVWDRLESLYAMMAKQKSGAHPLANFATWQSALCKRALTHENTNVRKYVLKELLARKYVTRHSAPFIFGALIEALDDGIILRDSNNYTMFSTNCKLVIDFYERYFANEAGIDDHRHLLHGTLKHVTHP